MNMLLGAGKQSQGSKLGELSAIEPGNEDLRAGKDSGLDLLDEDKMVDDRVGRKAFD